MPDKTVKELALEIQELRQFCIMLITNMPGDVIYQATKDYWWEKLGGYGQLESANL